ncbi:hypothetical protein PV325_012431 [Microctonus aethiopoides]|nr:hypothetical protein PV325_012431 [Microctonus aethiopoides]
MHLARRGEELNKDKRGSMNTMSINSSTNRKTKGVGIIPYDDDNDDDDDDDDRKKKREEKEKNCKGIVKGSTCSDFSFWKKNSTIRGAVRL